MGVWVVQTGCMPRMYGLALKGLLSIHIKEKILFRIISLFYVFYEFYVAI